MEIKEENVLAAYETARQAGADSTMKVLESLFGKEVFNKSKDVTERIKTFEDACRELGGNNIFVQEYKDATCSDFLTIDTLAYLKLRIVCAALNEGWEPQLTEDEKRWYPWHWLYTQKEIDEMDEEEKTDRCMITTGDYLTEYAGFACAHSAYSPSHPNSHFGSRLCLKSDTLATYCGKQFVELWADFKLIRR